MLAERRLIRKEQGKGYLRGGVWGIGDNNNTLEDCKQQIEEINA
jgi:hypothetical protein